MLIWRIVKRLGTIGVVSLLISLVLTTLAWFVLQVLADKPLDFETVWRAVFFVSLFPVAVNPLRRTLAEYKQTRHYARRWGVSFARADRAIHVYDIGRNGPVGLSFDSLSPGTFPKAEFCAKTIWERNR